MQEFKTREDVLRGLPQLAPGLYFAAVNWLEGTCASSPYKSEVREPPMTGWGTCLVLDREEDDRGKPMKTVTLFAVCWFDSYQVSRRSMEYQTLAHPEADRLKSGELILAEYEEGLLHRTKERLTRIWAEIMGYGWTQRDFDTAALIMRRLGMPVPLLERAEGQADRVSGGKEVSETGLLKPVKRSGRKGQILDFFWPHSKSIRECMAELGITRSNVLSNLYLLQKDHGIGYELKNDAAIVAMPKGVDWPWEEVDPLA